jgi:hypothetical protein
MTKNAEEGRELAAVARIQTRFPAVSVLEKDHASMLVRVPRRLESSDSLAHTTSVVI